jgi:hypothetical protein
MRDHLRSARISTWRGFTQRNVGSLFSFALLVYTAVLCQPKELGQRQVEIAAWAKQVTDMGITLDPRALGETAANFSVEGDKIVSHEGSSDPTFRNLVFFDSPSRDQAVNIARIHPGLHYGATVEVREWTDPRAIAVK